MKRPALKAALTRAVGGKAPAMPERISIQDRTPVRVGKRQIAGWFDMAPSKQLHQIALDEDTNLQDRSCPHLLVSYWRHVEPRRGSLLSQPSIYLGAIFTRFDPGDFPNNSAGRYVDMSDCL